ncbi:MAG: hypothetical protein FWF59_05985 [Turicibacter sp.]|nr:hypothetical protein [Turicibacter sp.]
MFAKAHVPLPAGKIFLREKTTSGRKFYDRKIFKGAKIPFGWDAIFLRCLGDAPFTGQPRIMGAILFAHDLGVILEVGHNLKNKAIFDENLLMLIATVGAFAIQQPIEAISVMFLYQIGGIFQECSIARSRNSITDLLDIRPSFTPGSEKTLSKNI